MDIIQSLPPKPKLTKSVAELSKAEALKLLAEIEEYQKATNETVRQLQEADPFWFYDPSTGDVPKENYEFLIRHLKPEDVPVKLTGQLDAHLSHAPIRFVSGGNQCLGGETLLFDSKMKRYRRVDSIESDFNVYAWDGKRVVEAKAKKPFKKEADHLYRFDLSNGESFVGSLSHLILSGGGYLPCSELHPGYELSLPASILEFDPLAHASSDLNSSETIRDFQYDCLSYPHFYDGLLRWVSENDQEIFPLQDDVHAHRELVFSQMDVQVCKPGYTHPYQYASHLSSQDVQHRISGHVFDFGHQSVYRPWKSSYPMSQGAYQPRGVSAHSSRSKIGFARRARQFSSSLFSSMSPLVVTKVTYLRHDVKYDFNVPIHNNYFAAGIIHHNSGKTTSGCIEAFITATGCVPKKLEGIFPKERIPTTFPQYVRVIGKDWTNGILLNVIPTYQKWVPREFLRGGRWDKSYNSERATLYLEKAGKLFGTIEFMSNAQDVTSFQGPPRDMMVYDEEPRKDIYKENLLRFTTRDRLNILFCMTPTEGLTWVHDELVAKDADEEGNRVDVFRIASVCNKKANIRVLNEIVKDLTYDEKKMRLLGEFISLSGLVYGRTFNNQVHIIPSFDVACNCGMETQHWPDCPYNKYVVYRGIDPHLVTPAAVVWVAVDRFENVYVVKSMFEETDIDPLKKKVALESKGMRLSWSVVDSAADSNIEAFGGLNIFKKLRTGEDKIRALRLAVKGQGSIKTGVDEIRQYLAINEATKKPRLFVMDNPSNKLLINAFATMERDSGHNEDKRGMRDKILESKHHLHAALRYLFMQKLRWRDPNEPEVADAPSYQEEEIFA